MKSTKPMSNRRNDQVYIKDMLSIGLIDAEWLHKLPVELAARLKEIIATRDA